MQFRDRQTLIHGLSSGIISYFRGGSFRAGFYSGLGSAFDVGTEKYGGMVGRTSIMAIIGGTFAKLGGGKFANGAMSAAFTHLFNYEYKDAVRTKRILEAKGYGKRGLNIEYGGNGKNSYYVKDKNGFIYGGYLPEEIKQAEGFGRALMIPYGIVGGGILRGGYVFAMMRPEVTIGTGVLIENLDGYYGGSSPSLNIGSAINGFEMSTGIQIVPDGLKP